MPQLCLYNKEQDRHAKIVTLLTSALNTHSHTSTLAKWSESRSVASNSLRPHGLYLPGSSVRGVLQVWILEWVAISFSRGSSQLRDRTQVSCMAGRLSTDWATREALPASTSYHWYSRQRGIQIQATPFILNLRINGETYFLHLLFW